jgi:uroporphyrinogen decarboxylase
MLNDRDNYLRTIEGRYPEWLPCSMSLSPANWRRYPDGLEDLCLRHPLLFPDFQRGSVDLEAFGEVYRQGARFRDNWGCLWHNLHGGLEGQVVEHPLADWRAFDTYRPPDWRTHSERGVRDWDAIRRDADQRRRRGQLVRGDGERLFDRLYFLRGFESLMLDFATDEPRLQQLIDMLLEYEMGLVGRWLEIGVDIISFHTDIGTQNGLMISPAQFRHYLKPMFSKLFTTCRDAGAHVYLSSDGRLLEIVDDLIECGVSVHDPQLRANTLDGIATAYQGRLCVNLDLDRQSFPFLSPAEIQTQVEESVTRLYRPEGGLMLMAAVWDETIPLDNVEALAAAMEECSQHPQRTFSG